MQAVALLHREKKKGKKNAMTQKDNLHIAQEFLARMGRNTTPEEIAKLFSENMEWEIAGDIGAFPWIGKKFGRAAVIDFVNDSQAMIERISFEVYDILTNENRAVILGSLISKLKRTGKIVKTDFAIILTIKNSEIARFQMFEDSYAVSQVARGG